MVEMVEQVIDSILSIENEQSKVLAYVSELEMRRKQLQNQLGSIEDVLTNGAKIKLYNKIMQMEMKISFVEPTEKLIINGSKQRKCRHNNVGYCKMEAQCAYFHKDNICDQYLTNGKCTNWRLCPDRHPKECKFWLGDSRGCLRGQICKHLHKEENKGKKIKAKDTNSHIHKGDDAPLNSPNSHDMEPNNTGYNQNHENESDMEEETSPRDEIIVKLRTKSDTLETENKELKEQLEKLTQVMINMNNALKSKQG